MQIFEKVIEQIRQGNLEGATYSYMTIVNEEGKPPVETKASAMQVMKEWYDRIRIRVLTRREKGE